MCKKTILQRFQLLPKMLRKDHLPQMLLFRDPKKKVLNLVMCKSQGERLIHLGFMEFWSSIPCKNVPFRLPTLLESKRKITI
jgi:hypothetical protein